MLLSLLLVCVALWAGWFGLPKPLVRRLLPLDEIEASRNLTFEWDRLRWVPWLGAIADNVRFSRASPAGGPGFTVFASRVRVNALDSRRYPDATRWRISLSGARLNSDSADIGEFGPYAISAFLVREGETLHLNNLVVESERTQSHSRGRDFLRGSASFDSESGLLNGEFFLRGDPERYPQVRGANMPEWLRYMEFRRPVQLSAEFALNVSDPATLITEGRLQTGDFQCRGEQVAALDVDYYFEDGRWLLSRVNLLRRDGFLRGWIDLDTLMDTVSLEINSTIPPDALARMSSPGMAARFSRYSLASPVDVTLSGFARYGEMREMELNLKLRTAEAAYRKYTVQGFSMEANLTELGVDVYDFRGSFGEGAVSGDGVYEFSFPPWRPWFDFDLGVREVSLADVAGRYTHVENPYDYEGKIVGRLMLAGPRDTREGRELLGGGFLDIRDGYILTLPLLGGLSRYLAAIYPGIGYAEQRSFECTFDVRGGAVRSDDIRLAGEMLAMQGHGTYHFDERVKFRVVVKLFEQGGLLSRLARFVTAPISKALEFELTGTRRNPKWAPLNTPKRLLRFFQRTLGLD